MATKKAAEAVDYSTEEKIIALYEYQKTDSQIDEVNKLKGELPLEVGDLEDEVQGLETRVEKLNEQATDLDQQIKLKKGDIERSTILIKKYEEQQNNVRNNREFDALNKEIEYQHLEIELSEKRIKEYGEDVKEKKVKLEETIEYLEGRKIDLGNKKKELEKIEKETEVEMKEFEKLKANAEKKLDDRLLNAYKRIRKNMRNKIAVAPITRDACGGCFNSIPPQKQFEIRQNRKIVVCEYCGRIIVSDLLDPIEEA